MTNPPPVAPVVTDEMVAAAISAYDHECEHFDTETQDALDMHTSAIRAAITAALEASGELERLRAALVTIDALDPEWQGIESCHPDTVNGLVLRMGEIARTALQGDAP